MELYSEQIDSIKKDVGIKTALELYARLPPLPKKKRNLRKLQELGTLKP